MEPFISLCMITKDEESVLNRCLDSVQGLVDEIIIADTGSVDSTKEIAASYTKHVYDFQWTNDFSAARNFVQSKASGQWIIYLDADEYVDEENFKDVLTQLKSIDRSKENAFMVTQVNFLGDLGEGVTHTSTIRIYKNLPSISFYRKVHEQLQMENGNLYIGSLNLMIYHSGYLAHTIKAKDKNSRNTPLINTELKDNADGFDYFNLGNENLSQMNFSEAADLYKKAFQKKESIYYLWVPLAVERLIHCLGNLKRYEEALEIVEEAIELWSGAIDFRVQKAWIYYSQNRYYEAKRELKNLNWDKQWKVINNVNYLEYLPYKMLGNIYEEEKNLTNAVLNYSKAINFNKNDTEIIKRLFGLLLTNHSDNEVAEFIEKNNLMNSPTSQRIYLKSLLDIGAASLVHLLVQRKQVLITKGLEMKMLLAEGDFEIINSKINDYSALHLFADNYFDLFDLVIVAIRLKKEELHYMVKNVISDEEFVQLESLITMTNIDDSLNLIEHLLSKLIKLRMFELFEYIVGNIHSSKHNNVIARVLFGHGMIGLSAEFYAQAETIKFNEKDFVNVMKLAIQNKDIDLALTFGFEAINLDKANFVVYEMIMHCLEARGDKKDSMFFREIMDKEFPSSRIRTRDNHRLEVK
ncbi:glycosyltransferase [Terribacillus sp. 179-K 1B1 HS]|uniref:tetratricopeptide repeat-containing glycosyltransferase family 2 protein n=1 Tax=Terribacillus sp. 179-K 1B1 HS TaxID=3142388 RepID=UPI00399FEEB4